uniref:Windei n=1 Tax=Blattella germanica TaxID=6973 RepID=X5J628_BLAGE|nr:windei [Blattella germanica]
MPFGCKRVPLEMSESKLSVPLEFSYSFSSSDENLSINKDLAENGIPIESSFDTEGNYVFSEDRTNSVFEFEDSEKFGLSDSEVDKLLKDVDGKEKSDSSKRTKTNEEKENGHTNEKEADKVGQKRCFNLEENSEREAKRTRVEESRSNDSQSSSQCKTGNNSAVETNEQIDSSEIKEKKGSSESTSEISKLKIKDSDLLIKRSDVGKISNVTDRTNCSFELSKKDKILTKDCPIMPFGCKRVHEPGNIIEVKKVKFTPEMERHLSIINSSEKFQSKLLRRDIVSEVKKGEAKMGIKLDSKGTKDRLEGEVECKKSDNLTSAVISKNLTLDTSEKVLKTDKNEKLDTSPKDSEVEGKNISEKLEIKGNDEKPETEFSSKKLFSDTTIKKHNEEKSETTGGGEKCEIKSISEKMEITSSEKLESNNAFDKLLESKSVTETLQSEEAIKKFKTKDSLDKLESKDSEKVESKDPSEKYENKGASDNFRSIDVSEESESDVASEKSVDKSTSKKEENKDSSSKQSTTTREAESSVPPKSPKSNLDLAIERVALGLTDSDKEEEVEEEEDNSAVGSNPLPSVRNLRKNLLKNLSRFEWEELIMQKLTESISERSEVGDMRQRVQTQDQMLEYWRRKAQQLQKQLKDMEMVLKRYIGDARTRKDRPIPVKITRSVGLQVHMGPVNQGMVRNRPIGNNEPPRNQAQVRRRANRVSSPPVAGTMQQQQNQQQQNQQQQNQHQQTSQNQSSQQPHHQQQQHSQQQQQQQQQQHQHHQQQQQTPQKQTTTVVGTSITSPLTVQKVVTAGYTKLTASTPQTIAPRPSITQATAQSQINRIQKIAPAPSPMKSVTRPGQSHTIISTAGSSTSTVSTVNSTAVNATNSLRIASAAQLNNRQPVKPTGSYTTPTKIIDLTDEEDRAKANNLRTVQTSVANSMITTNAVTSGVVPISSSSNIQTGSIRVVQPHQLTGTTTTTLLASPAPTTGNSRVAYFVPSTGVSVPQRQVLIASSAQQVRPGVMTVSSRQNQFSTLVLKNGAYVPLSQASGTQSVNTAILRSAPSMQSTQLQQVLPARPGQQIRVAPGIVTTVGRMPTPAITNVSTITNKHPAPLPNQPLYQPNNANWKCPPPKPELKISKGANKHQQGIVLSWNMTLTSEYDEIASYQLYAYQEGSAQPSTTLWKKVGDVKALPLPMACTLTQFMEGHKYHFAVRAVDVHMRVGPFSAPGNIVLTRK